VKRKWPDAETFKKLGQDIRHAKEAEKKRSVDFIKMHLGLVVGGLSEPS